MFIVNSVTHSTSVIPVTQAGTISGCDRCASVCLSVCLCVRPSRKMVRITSSTVHNIPLPVFFFTFMSLLFVKLPLAVASLRLYAMGLSICLSVCLSVTKMRTRKRNFIKN